MATRRNRDAAGRLLLAAAALIVSSGAARAAEGPPGATVESLLALGERLNPAVRAAGLDTTAAAAQAEAAGALDDPVLTENYQNYHSGGLFSMNFITISQTFPLGGKRDLRHRAALSEVDAARGRERAAQDELDAQIKIAFARYYAFTRALVVNRQIQTLARKMRQATMVRYGQGDGAQSGVIQAQEEETNTVIEASRLEAERESAAAQLNALLARPPGAPLAEPMRLRPIPAVLPRVESLLDRARSGNGAVHANSAAIDEAESRRRLAERAWYPDVTVGGGPVVQTNAPTGFSAMVSLSIPVQFGAKRADEDAQTARLDAAERRRDGTMATIQAALAEALARLKAARDVESLLRRQRMPQADALSRTTLASYSQGHGDLAAAIAAEHQMHDTELELLRTETDEQTELATIERLIGGDL
ncbi:MULTISPECIES: TolC family protein [Acetobacteraceae]|uniref:TolC family protein n=1 Tax=Acetobacter fallax TaxID=1737473 RepID=A0ABX0K9G3_9PROT|nr:MULTISPECIES: TolC family protein [Acetobacteraceae]MDF3624661.1 TolC family protein [Brytella acorum]NHO32069.1 TolC family protein [Acetobacter fallax]NHO35660.1 TolC family protein [Acetobacter fallax]